MKLKHIFFLSILLLGAGLPSCSGDTKQTKRAMVGVYYYDGWSTAHRRANDPEAPWAKNVSRQVTKRFIEEFPGREPVWGWRHDTQEIMERQIDLAADNGVDFFLFCWYWRDDKGPMNLDVIENMPQHVSLKLYLKAKNKHRVKFGFLVANHHGGEIEGDKNWSDAVKYWTQYLKDPQYVTVDGKPIVVIFNSTGVENETLYLMQDVAKSQGLKNGLAIAGCGKAAIPKDGFTHRTHYNIVPGYGAGSEEHRFSELVAATKEQWTGTEAQPYMPEITVGWDKRPWEGPDGNNQVEGWYFPDNSPEHLRNFMEDAIRWMDDNPTKTPRERIILLYAWNELGEGGYLVPTKGDPNASMLKVVKEVVFGN